MFSSRKIKELEEENKRLHKEVEALKGGKKK